MVYIRFASHRARKYGLDALSRTPQEYYSLRRKQAGAGIYLVAEEEIATMRAHSAHARFARLRKPYYDLYRC